MNCQYWGCETDNRSSSTLGINHNLLYSTYSLMTQIALLIDSKHLCCRTSIYKIL